jgi:hypothetical protein
MRSIFTTALVVFSVALLFSAASSRAGQGGASTAIAKCKDADGKWHYGDFAADECEQSKITHIDEQGVRIKESLVTPTVAESNARRAAEDRRRAEERRNREQVLRDQRLLTKYDSELAIIKSRDQRIGAVDAMVTSQEAFLHHLQERQIKLQRYAQSEKYAAELEEIDTQISAYESSIAARNQERTEIARRYEEDLERYREITKRLRRRGLVDSTQ